MNILAIDTTSAIASVAVMKDDGTTGEVHSEQKMKHLENLMKMTDSLLAESELSINDITHIAISEGPGSFTGIRIGAATAKMLAQVLDILLIPVPTLMSYAYAAADFKGLICPMLDARRSQVYAAAYEWRSGACKEAVPGGAYSLEEFLDRIRKTGDILFVGDGAIAYEKDILAYGKDCGQTHHPWQKRVSFDNTVGSEGLAVSVCEIALQKLKRDETVDVFSFKPVYMRLAEAQRKLEER